MLWLDRWRPLYPIPGELQADLAGLRIELRFR
jgi:hypothetical protein